MLFWVSFKFGDTAFEVRSKILFYLRIPDQLFQSVLFGSRYCFPCLITLFYMAMEKEICGKQFGPKSRGSSGRVSAPSVVGRLTEQAGVPRLSLTGVCENGTFDLGVSTSRHSVRNGLLVLETISFLEPRSLTFSGWLPSAPPAASLSGPELQRESQKISCCGSTYLGDLAQQRNHVAVLSVKTSALQGSK